MVPAKVHEPVITDGSGAGGGSGEREGRTARRRVPAADGVTS